MKRIIGVAGARRAGKDTVSDYLVRQYKFKKMSFAEPLKMGLCAILGIEIEELEELKNLNATHSLLNKTYRNMLETLGTEWGRDQVNKDIWTTLVAERIKNHTGNIVLSDVRFSNEAKLIRDLGGFVIYVKNENAEKAKGSHSCETSLKNSDVDIEVDNYGTLQQLYESVNYAMRDIAEPNTEVKEYTVKLRRDNGWIVKKEAEQLDGLVFGFTKGWLIDDQIIYYGEYAMLPIGNYPEDAPTWIASGDLELKEN